MPVSDIFVVNDLLSGKDEPENADQADQNDFPVDWVVIGFKLYVDQGCEDEDFFPPKPDDVESWVKAAYPDLFFKNPDTTSHQFDNLNSDVFNWGFKWKHG